MTKVLLLASRAELTFRARQPVLYLAVVGLTVLVWFSAQVGASELLTRRENYATYLAELAHEQVVPRAPLVGFVQEPVLRAIRPPELGSVFVRGEDLNVPAYFDFGPAGVVWARNVATDTMQLHGGTLLDLESIVRTLGGFLALLLGFTCIADAKARGTLKAWHALGTGAVPTVVGRLVGCWLLAAAVVSVMVVAAGVSAVVILPGDTSELARVLARCWVPIVLYAWLFTSLGAAIAVWARNYGAALAGGVALWIVAAMVWPQVVALGARIRAPNLFRVAMELQRERAFGDAVRAGEDGLGDKLVSWIGEAPADESAAAIRERRTELDAIWRSYARTARTAAKSIEDDWRIGQSREDLFGRWAYLTPGTPFIRSVSGLAGTGSDLGRLWVGAAETYQAQLAQVLFDDWSQVLVRAPSQQSRQRLRFERHPGLRWQDAPVFQAPQVTPRHLWADAVGPLLVLFAYCCVAVGIIIVGAPRLVE